MEEILTDEEILNHVQHMGCEEMDGELIESDDDGVDMGPSCGKTFVFLSMSLICLEMDGRSKRP